MQSIEFPKSMLNVLDGILQQLNKTGIIYFEDTSEFTRYLVSSFICTVLHDTGEITETIPSFVEMRLKTGRFQEWKQNVHYVA